MGLNFNAALQTDVYSFGLLVWETINGGRSYFNKAWLDADLDVTGEARIDAMEAFLNSLPQNKLLAYSEHFLLLSNLDVVLHMQVSRVLHSCLQDDPPRRRPMSTMVKEMTL